MPARSVRSVLPTVIRFVLLALVIGFAFAYLARQWGAVSTAVARLSPVALAGSMLFLVLGLVAATVAWVALLNGLVSRRFGRPRSRSSEPSASTFRGRCGRT
jgi:uncharacterized membrane protein YedE/YeeE